ncbi:THAP domain-containing protein 5-like [Centruroides sculpturatus]|uniref:THAP domain-containing protein 5-like n=1 Tax=Centruroides sculpturatus TaxID=218467 RepID=UPI000C6CEFC8|nr:THAP domain-containing protein 5-like [Centruroides sculpturatus]
MPAVCSAYNCTNRSNQTTNISYFKFPLRDKELTKQWVSNMRRYKWYPTKASYLCSAHFEVKYLYDSNGRKRRLAKAVPTLFSFSKRLKIKHTLRSLSRKRALEDSTSTHMSSGSHEINDHNYCLDRQYNSYHVQVPSTNTVPSPRKLKKVNDRLVRKRIV